jgi:hypothetical protein
LFCRYLGGNYPIFPKDTNSSETFEKRFYTFRAKEEEIYLYAIYDHPGKNPFLVIANFHTNEISSTFTKHQRPLISKLYNDHMVGVDAFDQHVFAHTVSRKVDKWPVRIIESCFTFALVNARAAHCVKMNIDYTKYSMKKFYLDIIRLHYPPVYKISGVKLEFKAQAQKYNQCHWEKCKKTSKSFCNNEKCQKLACKDHMAILCCQCFGKKNDIILNPEHKQIPSRICKIITFCKVLSRVLCASKSCKRVVCANHRHLICYDCCIMHLSSAHSNYSEKIISKKICY